MKLVNVSIELVIDDDISTNKDAIVTYLNHKLYTDPEWFGEFGPENILEIKEWE